MTRNMYNTISNLMGEEGYPEYQWQERIECFDQLSPQMNGIMEKAWEGIIDFWESRGQEGDIWKSCDHNKWFESNCTYQPGLGLAIWEPCNYASNLAYDRYGNYASNLAYDRYGNYASNLAYDRYGNYASNLAYDR